MITSKNTAKEFDELFKNHTQELLNILKKLPTPREHNLDESYHNVRMLIDFMEVIIKHKDELNYPINVAIVQRGFNPTAIFLDYIILEISSFYTNAEILRGNGSSLPDPPDYWSILKEFRDSKAHRDKKHKLKTLADHTALLKKIDSIGLLKIVEDFIEYNRKMKGLDREQSPDFKKD